MTMYSLVGVGRFDGRVAPARRRGCRALELAVATHSRQNNQAPRSQIAAVCRPVILLSFDIEEFDLPKEHGVEITLEEGVRVSEVGVERILEMLERQGVKATFFCTGNFAKRRPELIRRMVKEGHEVGCHGVDHFRPEASDYEKSKKIVEKTVKKEFPEFLVAGYRAPRMQKIDYVKLAKLGYLYDSSVNPTFIPGRYNNFSVPRQLLFACDCRSSAGRVASARRRGCRALELAVAAHSRQKNEQSANSIYEIPTSVVGVVRFPLFWLALHHLPVKTYIWLCRKSLKETGYLAVYFHPWEFAEIKGREGVPGYIGKNSGEEMVRRLERVIVELKKDNEFIRYKEFCSKK